MKGGGNIKTENQIDFQKNFTKFIVDICNINEFDKKYIKDKIDLFYEVCKLLSHISYNNQQARTQYYLMNNQNYTLNNNYFKF